MQKIPVCLPKMPVAELILPYLQQMDKSRWYTNFGPLVREFESRIASLLNVSSSQVVTGTNGTLLLEICLKAFGVETGSLCIMPSWTFIATPLAAVSANLEPLFVDVDLKTQLIEPKKLLNDLPMLSQRGKIGAVIVVAPFGNPINTKEWDDFTDRTGIPVLIDAAAAFDTILQKSQMHISKTPMMISMHATKVLGMGEAGVLVSTNEDLMLHIENMTQFGFPRGVRNSYMKGTNAKMSEYGAAVGLAALDSWSITRAAWQEISHYYQHALNTAGIKHMQSLDWVTSTCNVIVPNQAGLLSIALEQEGVSTRKWWGDGCHRQTVFQHVQCDSDLRNTEYLSNAILGLPFYVDMGNEIIDVVMKHLSNAVLVAGS